jgi:hypothetical protein
LLTARDGRRITSSEDWESIRRPELLELFRAQVYGRSPTNPPDDLNLAFSIESSPAMDGKAIRKTVTTTFSGPHGQTAFPFTVFIPARRSAPAPAFLTLAFYDPHYADPTRSIKHEFWPAEEIVNRGYAAVALYADDVAVNDHNDFTRSVHAVFEAPGAARSPDAWGTLAAWAWAASRIMDYLQTDPDIDSTRIAIVGHSRSGKAALWAGAQDQRFALTISNNSGCSGAALSRKNIGDSRPGGETLADINTRFPDWFCDNYKHYNANEAALPIDQHMLIALIAPRLVYVASAEEDLWADPINEFASCFHAQPAWQLYNLPTLSTRSIPLLDYPLLYGRIGYHIRTGQHDLSAYDWQQYLAFADLHFPEIE